MKNTMEKNHEPFSKTHSYILKKSAFKYKQHIAYDHLKEAIISGEYPPEKPLVERELCDTLGVSRTPVREALRRLTSEGLAESFPGRGVFVSRVTLEKSVQLHELKEALERMAVRLCTVRMENDELERLWKCIQEHTRAMEQGDMTASADTDLVFHVLLVEGAHSPILEQQAKGLLLQTRRLSQLYIYDPASSAQFIPQHTEIYRAIQARDAEAAERAVSVHYEAVKKYQRETWHLLF
jgi:DNA-binding GntR family transcriptional regulator